MGMRVITPDGKVLTYNDARFLLKGDDWGLYTRSRYNEDGSENKDAQWIASFVPAPGLIVESVPACKIERVEALELDAALDTVLANIGKCDGRKLAELKSLLKDFNAKTKGWPRDG